MALNQPQLCTEYNNKLATETAAKQPNLLAAHNC